MPDHLKPLHVRSVCEQCDPSVSTTTYSITPGYVHDRDFAKNHLPVANEYGLVFGDWSNGCQVLPSVPILDTEAPELSTALASPTSAAIVDVAARAANAITATRDATPANYMAKVASAWYLADPATCVKSGDVCQSTPSEIADAMGVAFETSLFYGHSISRVKVQQGLALLDLATDTSDAAMTSDLKKDIVAHMLIPFYQGTLAMAHELDVSVDKATAQANGATYWKVIDDAVGDDFASFDRNRLAAIFTASPQGTDNYCTALTLLRRNLPEASQLQYSGSHSAGQVSTSTVESVVHVTQADIGILTASREASKVEGVVEGEQSYGGYSSYGSYSYGGSDAAVEAEQCSETVVSRYPIVYISCGVMHTLMEPPSRVVTMNQGVTEFMLAMGLKDKMAGTAYIDVRRVGARTFD